MRQLEYKWDSACNCCHKFLQNKINHWIRNKIEGLEIKPDLVWINSGELFGPLCLKTLKQMNVPIVLYNNDDPTGNRDGQRFAMLLKAIPFYDLTVVMRNE